MNAHRRDLVAIAIMVAAAACGGSHGGSGGGSGGSGGSGGGGSGGGGGGDAGSGACSMYNAGALGAIACSCDASTGSDGVCNDWAQSRMPTPNCGIDANTCTPDGPGSNTINGLPNATPSTSPCPTTNLVASCYLSDKVVRYYSPVNTVSQAQQYCDFLHGCLVAH